MTTPTPPEETPERDNTDHVLIAIQRALRHLGNRIDTIDKRTSRAGSGRGGKNDPGPWVWPAPPIGSEDVPDTAPDPRVTVGNFVVWYNAVYAGPGTRTRAIPPCWQRHLGLAQEIAALAYDWREANLGPTASAREAVLWHHVRRPGFDDRMYRHWIPESCLDGEHPDSISGATSRFHEQVPPEPDPPDQPAP